MSGSTQSLEGQDTPNLAMRLRELICGYWISQCIAVAARLGIADLLQSGSKSVAELADNPNAAQWREEPTPKA